MVAIPVSELEKRYYYYSNGSSSSWIWGRWILFAILIVVVIVVIFGTNWRRRKRGAAPIIGTSWLAPPPSYAPGGANNPNSEYNPNNPQMTQPLPLYSENVNQNDMGYYDSEGKFIPTSPQNAYYEGFPLSQEQANNANATATADPAGDPNSEAQPGSSSNVHVERPEAAAASLHEGTYQRPPGPPPGLK